MLHHHRCPPHHLPGATPPALKTARSRRLSSSVYTASAGHQAHVRAQVSQAGASCKAGCVLILTETCLYCSWTPGVISAAPVAPCQPMNAAAAPLLW